MATYHSIRFRSVGVPVEITELLDTNDRGNNIHSLVDVMCGGAGLLNSEDGWFSGVAHFRGTFADAGGSKFTLLHLIENGDLVMPVVAKIVYLLVINHTDTTLRLYTRDDIVDGVCRERGHHLVTVFPTGADSRIPADIGLSLNGGGTHEFEILLCYLNIGEEGPADADDMESVGDYVPPESPGSPSPGS